MKRIKFILSALAAMLAPTVANAARLTNELSLTAYAETESYACVTENDTYFYSSADDESGLFILPATYYVKIISKSDDYCFVQYLEDVADYKAVYGYCKTDSLTAVNFIPERPYLYYTYSATYTIEGSAAAESGNFSTFTCECIYYGDYKNGTTTYRYVCINGEFGYIPKTCEITYPLNTDYLPSEPDISEPADVTDPAGTTDGAITETDKQSAAASSGSGVGLGLIIALSAILIALAIFVLAVKPRKKKSYTYEN